MRTPYHIYHSIDFLNIVNRHLTRLVYLALNKFGI